MKRAILIPTTLIICILGATGWFFIHEDLEISQAAPDYPSGKDITEIDHQLQSANAEIAEMEFTIEELEHTLRTKEKIAADMEVSIDKLGQLNYDLQRKSNLRDFKSTDELEEFLANSPIDHTIYAKGNLDLRTYDCEDYALALRDDAYSKGFHMNIQAVWDYRRPDTGELITEYNEGHAMNSTIIGNEMYFIEPQTDEYWLATYLD